MTTTRPMAIIELQVAAQARLTGDGTLMGMITGVFDQVRGNQALPYVSYGQHVDGPWATFGHWNSEAFFLLDIWSNASGDEEAYRILAEIRRLLETRSDNPPLTLANYGHVGMHLDWSTIMIDPDFGLRHLQARFISHAVEL